MIINVLLALPVVADDGHGHGHAANKNAHSVQLGPRPYYLINDMEDGELKRKLQSCADGPFKKSEFSIGHRGAGLQFPEHTRESYIAAAHMGAGIVECDVTFTADKELVCRHSQCDLHTTTNILATSLASKCSQPFQPAVYDAQGNLVNPASAQCCTSDLTLAEFKTLKGKMDAANPGATTVEEYMNSTPDFRTDLYTGNGTLMTHAESIALFKSLGVKMTPELKSPSVPMPFDGFTQTDFAQKMIDEYKKAGVKPQNVWAQSFNYDDILYWIQNEPEFGKQAVYLDGRYDDPTFDYTDPSTWSPGMMQMAADGVNIIAPPMWMLVSLDSTNRIVPSIYTAEAKAAGLDIITWTLERSGLLQNGGGWYYQSVTDAIDDDGDTMVMLDVLAKEVGVLGIFSDWPATVTYYANCMKLK
ncbi:MAG: glycerophosphodiester phosphodiesterase family protein [Gammaproteobacteria bacterium]